MWKFPLRGIQSDGFLAGLLDIAFEVVLEIASDSRQMMLNVDVDRLELITIADPA